MSGLFRRTKQLVVHQRSVSHPMGRYIGPWWNSTDFGHFSRTWNRTVYRFLLRHVHLSAVEAGATKGQAAFLTFLLSSILHEVVLTLVTKKFRPILFFFQMSQLPLTMIGSLAFFKQNSRLTNGLWWSGMMLAFPLIGLLYVWDFGRPFGE